MTKEQKIISIAEKEDWSVHVSELKNKCVQFEFSQFTPAGQDFNFSAEMTNRDTQTLIKNIKEYYENFDPDMEAYLWIGENGHGKNGAPYHIKDIVDDMSAAEDMVYQLYLALDKVC